MPARTPLSGSGWLHEIKHDGYRIMAERDHGSVRLYTRNGYDFADRFPLAAAAIVLYAFDLLRYLVRTSSPIPDVLMREAHKLIDDEANTQH
jgi:hypothetical protein